jgi:hypothetical protein
VSNCRRFGSDRRSVVPATRAAHHPGMSLITNPWPVDGRLGDPDPLRRAARLEGARIAIEPTGPFSYQVVDLDHGTVGWRRSWGGAEELAHQYADLRDAPTAA